MGGGLGDVDGGQVDVDVVDCVEAVAFVERAADRGGFKVDRDIEMPGLLLAPF